MTTFKELESMPVTNREEAIAILKATEDLVAEEPHIIVDLTLEKLLRALWA